ncbi:hypothetical protein C8J57DRAFT_1228338 [Mycena rebaudengoi]|nr:hypothetical protein C8J57DRAFT_1228338 [Mycena rebaudengoi]
MSKFWSTFMKSCASLSRGVLPTALLYDIAKFTEALEKLFTVLNGQQKGTLGKIKALFRQPEAGEKLERCKQELSQMLGLFKAQVTGSTLSQMGQMKRMPRNKHEQLVALLEKDSALTGSDWSSEAWERPALPQQPSIIHKWKPSIHIDTLFHATRAPLALSWQQTIADHIGLEKGSNMTKKVAHYFSHAPPSLLVLDNLETPWEALSARSEVEELLSILTDALHLGLMITLRGAEHPRKVKWDPPLPGPSQATFQCYDDSSIKELLELTGNLPLAVSLIAVLQVLKDVPRHFLGGNWKVLGCFLMMGLQNVDLVQAQLPIPDILACKATLIRTALAFVDQDQYLKVLVPIREHILSVHPPQNKLEAKATEHFHQILDLWNQFKNLNVADIHPQISLKFGNFNTVLHDGLESEGPDIVQNFRSILFLNHFYGRVQDTYSPLLLQLSGQMLHWKDNRIFGDLSYPAIGNFGYLPDLDLDSTSP